MSIGMHWNMAMQTKTQFERSEFERHVKELDADLTDLTRGYAMIVPGVVALQTVLSRLLDLIKEVHDAQT